MNAQEQCERCPVKIGQEFGGGIVTYILGDSQGWNVWIRPKDQVPPTPEELQSHYRISVD